MRYLVEGKVIPERVDFSLPKVQFGMETYEAHRIEFSVEIWKSKIFIHVTAPREVTIATIRNLMFTAVGNIVNYAGFRHVIGVSYELDSITEVDEKWTQVFGTEGFVFDSNSEFGDRITFNADNFGAAVSINPNVFLDSAMARATFELRNAIRYPDFTALHCRLAIEAIRDAFNPDDEKQAWKLLRENLNVSRETIESFKDVATAQRHGKNRPQTWEQRRRLTCSPTCPRL